MSLKEMKRELVKLKMLIKTCPLDKISRKDIEYKIDFMKDNITQKMLQERGLI